ncbi:Aste57867_15512 [Aphanomyces stellatus]|uniref:Aste57867_15512 protein n=1 Tax=Aphanomyces stellatus TaxID=120398 RepID=A0A485L494_9STRA|nr:hypothetical protein As57867_015456 [Aphanomyces stellatus]VFT92314.1 Aste57867_15512 [Aphanomyces stellatus]
MVFDSGLLLAVLLNPDLSLHLASFQPGVQHHLLAITAAARVLLQASCPTPTQREAAETTRLDWFHTHGVDGLRKLYRTRPAWLDGSFLAFAASIGHVDAVRFLLSQHPDADDLGPAVLQAVQRGDLAILELFSSGFSSYTMNLAAARGHVHVVAYLHPYHSCTHMAMDKAAAYGHLDVVKFLHVHRTEGCSTDAMDAAAAGGHLAIVEFLHTHRTEGCTKKAMDRAAAGGHMDVVRFLHVHRTEGCHDAAMDAAAARGDLAMVQFLHENRREGCTREALRAAAAAGHGHVVVYLVRQRRRDGCAKEAMAEAAAAGHEAIVRGLLVMEATTCEAHECDAKWRGLSLLRIALHETKAHGHHGLRADLKHQIKWKDRRDGWKQKAATVWSRTVRGAGFSSHIVRSTSSMVPTRAFTATA